MRLNSVFAALLLVTIVIPGVSSAQIIRSIAFPVDGKHSFRDDYSEPRGGGTREHRGIDIIADKMTPLVAATDGRITYVASPEVSWGFSITIRDSEGYFYRYLHMNNDTPGTDDGAGGIQYAYATGIERGAEVKKGQLVGWVGDSGNAEATTAHLHFEIRDPSRTYINPYETLRAADIRGSVATSTDAEQSGIQSTSGYVFTKALQVGSSGEDVRQLQMILKTMGFFDYPEITGYFGSVTRAAVIAFQKAQNIDPIGIVGPITRGVLNGI